MSQQNTVPKVASSDTTDKSGDKYVNAQNGFNHLNDTGQSSICSMIVPVWLSHCNKPEVERFVYALLDTQSDITFILEDTSAAFDLKGTLLN